MTDLIVHLHVKVSPLLPLFLRACVAYYAVKSWFVDVDVEAGCDRCVAFAERHLPWLLKVNVAAEG